jgi:hypothetical protein
VCVAGGAVVVSLFASVSVGDVCGFVADGC